MIDFQTVAYLKSYLKNSGLKGEAGASAYEIAVQNGFEGTEQEWLDSLKATDVLIPVASAEIAGVVKASKEILVGVDGTMSIGEISMNKVSGLDKALAEIKNEIKNIDTGLFLTQNFEVKDGIFENTLVNYYDHEIRVLFSKDTPWFNQSSGANANKNLYYFGFRAYAPKEATHYKEGLGEIEDKLFDFTNEFAGTDEYGRNYSIVWLPAAEFRDGVWYYFGNNSTNEKYVGWTYNVEWYKDNIKIGVEQIRINLINEGLEKIEVPYYLSNYAKVDDVMEATSWSSF